MNEKEALARVKTGNFNGGRGFDMQLLVDAVGIIGEMFKSGQISEVVRCEDCIHYRYYGLTEYPVSECTIDHCVNQDKDWFCADGERRDK